MSSTETVNAFKIAMLKGPYRQLMVRKLAALPEKQVRVQINNQTLEVSQKNTILDVANTVFGENIPFNCRAGICGACEATVNGKREKTCYTPVTNGMRVVTLDKAMEMWRQGTADE